MAINAFLKHNPANILQYLQARVDLNRINLVINVIEQIKVSRLFA
jgi:hypothetical protein